MKTRVFRLSRGLIGAAMASLIGCGDGLDEETAEWADLESWPDVEPQEICTDCGEEEPGGGEGAGSGSGSPGGNAPVKADLKLIGTGGECVTQPGEEVHLFVSNSGGTATSWFWVTVEFRTHDGVIAHHRKDTGLNFLMGRHYFVPMPANCVYPGCSGYRVRLDSTYRIDEAVESNNIWHIDCG